MAATVMHVVGTSRWDYPLAEAGAVNGLKYDALRGVSKGSKLASGAELGTGESLVSGSGKYEFAFQHDGNLVLYNRDPAARDKALWDSGSDSGRHGVAGVRCVMQADGNLVVYSSGKKALWASGTQGHGGAWCCLQDDGNAVIYGSGQASNVGGKGALWSTKTQGGHRPSKRGILGALTHSITHAMSTVGHGISSVVTKAESVLPPGVRAGLQQATKSLGHVVAFGMPVQAVIGAVLSGKSIGQAVHGELQDIAHLLPAAAGVAAMVPGIGTVAATALGAAAALAEGHSLKDIALQAALSAVPGGALGQLAAKAGFGMALGNSIPGTALSAVRSKMSGAAKQAFDVGVNEARKRVGSVPSVAAVNSATALPDTGPKLIGTNNAYLEGSWSAMLGGRRVHGVVSYED